MPILQSIYNHRFTTGIRGKVSDIDIHPVRFQDVIIAPSDSIFLICKMATGMMNIRLCLLLASLVLFRAADAQSPVKEVEMSIGNLNTAIVAKDKPMLEKLTAEELSYGHSTGV